MHRRNRHALICGILASAAALGGGAVLAGPASATTGAVPAASCTVTPAPNGMSVVITGEGFTGPRKLNDGESTEPLNIDANGNFRVQRFQKNVDYTVLAVNEDQNFVFVNCKVVAATSPSATPNGRDYKQGYNDGFRKARSQARQGDCAAAPVLDKSKARSDSYGKGWAAGAETGFQRYCP
ncbi:hypothetical protein [Streptomyces sp. NPDC056492]|uniref:hypothetical protein n=1 Tax=unclassified Streptomyces TaxID=2593676 RepID=UPI0036A5B7DE